MTDREEFEKYARGKGLPLATFPNGAYGLATTSEAWDAWQAAPQPVGDGEKEKALEVLRDNVRDKERGVQYQGLRDNDSVRDALHVLLSAQPPEGER